MLFRSAQDAVVEKEEKRIQEEREAVTFGELFEKYLPISKATKRNVKSWTREESLFRLWVAPVIGDKPLKDIAPIHIERIKAAMAKSGGSPRSIQYMLSFVKAVFNFAIRNGIFGSNPAAQVKTPKVNNKRIRFLSHDEADRLLAELATTSTQLRDMALLSLHTGMRAGEIFALTWGDIDPDRESISIRDSKSGRGRTVYMTEEVKAMFESMSAGGPSELVFKGRGGQIKMISGGFKRAVDRLGLNAGVQDPRQRVSFHSLRHSYASWLVGAGESLYVVKELLGHSDLAMTQRYSHLAPDSLKSAVKTFQKSIRKNQEVVATVTPLHATKV